MNDTIRNIGILERTEDNDALGILDGDSETTASESAARQMLVWERVSGIMELIHDADQSLGMWYGIGYREENSVDVHEKRQGGEVLLMPEWGNTAEVLDDIKSSGKSIDLFYRWLLEVFTRIIKWETGNISLNAFVADIGHKEFRYIVESTMLKFKTSDRKRIVIEIGEIGFGDINKGFIKNIIWLKDQGFHIALDDYDLLKIQWKSDISRKLLSAIWQYCEKIKLDHKTTAKILKNPSLQRFIVKHCMAYNHSVTAEWIHLRGDIAKLGATVKEFQIYKPPQNDNHFKVAI